MARVSGSARTLGVYGALVLVVGAAHWGVLAVCAKRAVPRARDSAPSRGCA